MSASICFLGSNPAMVEQLQSMLKECSIDGKTALLTEVQHFLQCEVFVCLILADVFALRQICEHVSEPAALYTLCLSDFDNLTNDFPSKDVFILLADHIDSEEGLDIGRFINAAREQWNHNLLCDVILTHGLTKRTVR